MVHLQQILLLALPLISPSAAHPDDAAIQQYEALLSLRALPDSPSGNYTPKVVDCPSTKPSVRLASELSDQEKSWISSGSGTLNTVDYWGDIVNQVQKKKEGWPTSITDYWGRALSYQLIGAPDGGPAYTFSSIADTQDFKDAQTPFPVLTVVSLNATVYEFNPYELGSWDPTTFGFAPLEWIASNFTNGTIGDKGKCVRGYDQFGFVMGTSSSLFNQFLLQNITAKGESFGLSSAIINPYRAVDIIFAVDSSADTTYSWPNGTALRATYDRSSTSISNGTLFPAIPSAETNVSTFDPQYTIPERDAIIRNGLNAATQGNATVDKDWSRCACFDRYCWDGKENNTAIRGEYEPAFIVAQDFNASQTGGDDDSAAGRRRVVGWEVVAWVVGVAWVLAAL
ncbi:unnamed protein product [Clonostachys rosea f. rosea IK726]|uniref:Lysophospholipase n=2 Tax=Bionectria ochroleuca TaxID=29856 RepID=A0A0B7JSF3_BIOOC|nr:unnamed protein product [Clonostachys rosea f. rosea IK726]